MPSTDDGSLEQGKEGFSGIPGCGAHKLQVNPPVPGECGDLSAPAEPSGRRRRHAPAATPRSRDQRSRIRGNDLPAPSTCERRVIKNGARSNVV